MRSHSTRVFADKILRYLQFGGGFLIVFLGASLKADVKRVKAQSALAGQTLEFIQDWAWILLVVFPPVVGLISLTRKHWGAPHLWGTLHSILTNCRENVFHEHLGAQYRDRVTLFRRKWAFWPRPGYWLVAVERSGYATRANIARFRANVNKPEKAEGIAGRAFVEARQISVNNLPDLSSENSEEAIAEYADGCAVQPDWVRGRIREGKMLARSIAAIPIEVAGKPWGVIVLDSQSANGIQNEQKQFRFIARILGKLLEAT